MLEPFSIDVSKHVKRNGPNVLAVRVHNAALNGGITQPVYVVLCDKPTTVNRQIQAVRVLAKTR